MSYDDIENHFSIEDYMPIAEERFFEIGRERAVTAEKQLAITLVTEPPDDAIEPLYHQLRLM